MKLELCKRQIHIVYYACINPNKEWDKIILSQLMEMYNSGILEEAVLHIEVCCELEENIKFVKDFIVNYFNEKNNCIYFLTILMENNYEYQGINKLYKEAFTNPDKVFIYIHSKGMFFNDKINDASNENKFLTKHTFNNWKTTLKMFQEDDNELNKASVFPSIYNWCWYNFFWASGKYLKTCEKPIIYKKETSLPHDRFYPDDRFYYERWLATGDNSTGYIYNLYENNYNSFTHCEVKNLESQMSN